MDTFEKLMSFQQDIYNTNVLKGFWPEGRNKGEAVMLIISELGEAVEAHRIGKIASVYLESGNTNIGYLTSTNLPEFISSFKVCIKDTLEDETADTVIRLLDTCYGFGFPLLSRDYRKETTGNFAHDVLRINWYILLAFEGRDRDDTEKQLWNSIHPGKDWGYALASIIALCEWYQIDIVQHVEWKLKYNKTRSFKHGKSY